MCMGTCVDMSRVRSSSAVEGRLIFKKTILRNDLQAAALASAVCIGMCINVCVDICVNMCIATCVDTSV